MRIVAIANQKGGCGKTTTAINLAGCMAFLGRRALIVDLDSQGHASLGLGLAHDGLEATLYDVLSPRAAVRRPANEAVLKLSHNLHLLPSDLTLAALEQELSGMPGRETRLEEALESLGGAYDFVFIDCAPGLGILTFNALKCAGEVLVPVECSLYSLHGLARFIETVRLAETEFQKKFLFHALIANFEPRTRGARRFAREIQELLKDAAFRTTVRRNVRLADAATLGQPISEFDRNSSGFKDYMACATELIERSPRAAARSATPWQLGAILGLQEPEALERVAAGLADEAVRAREEGSGEEPAEIATIGGEARVESIAAADAAQASGNIGSPIGSELGAAPTAHAAPPAAILEVRFGAPPGGGTAAPAEPGGLRLSDEPSPEGTIRLRLAGPRVVGDEVVFTYRAPADAQSVKIAGEFTQWRPEAMERDPFEEGAWRFGKALAKGAHRYKFIVNGEWRNDPANAETMPNPFGGIDSVIQV